MELRPIRTKREYQAALKQAEALWDAPQGTPEADRFEVIALLIETYERKHYPIDAPDPIDFLQHIMEARGLSRKDLEPYIGSRARMRECGGSFRAVHFATGYPAVPGTMPSCHCTTT